MNTYTIICLWLICVFVNLHGAEKYADAKVLQQKIQEHKDAIMNQSDLFAIMQQRLDERNTEYGMGKCGIIFTQQYDRCDSEAQRVNHFENYGLSLLTAISRNVPDKQKLYDEVALDCLCRLAQLQFPFYSVYVSKRDLSFSLTENYPTKKERLDLTKSILRLSKQCKFLSNIILIEFLVLALFTSDALLEGDYVTGGLGALGTATGLGFSWYLKHRCKNMLKYESLSDELVNRQLALDISI